MGLSRGIRVPLTIRSKIGLSKNIRALLTIKSKMGFSRSMAQAVIKKAGVTIFK